MMSAKPRLERARSFIHSGISHELAYAALELRQCLEALMYERLESARPHLPSTVLKIWQPPKLMKALLQFDSIADSGFTLEMSDPIEPGQSLPPDAPMMKVGEHRTFRAAWLQKHYHKLGSFLHAPINYEVTTDAADRRQYLDSIAAEIERVLGATITSAWFAEMHSCDCPQCGSKVSASPAAAHSSVDAIAVSRTTSACRGERSASAINLFARPRHRSPSAASSA